MPIELAQSVSGGPTGYPSGPTLTLSLPSPVAAGSLLVLVCGAWDNDGPALTVSDNLSNAWVAAAGIPYAATGPHSSFIYLYYCLNAKAGTTTVTIDNCVRQMSGTLLQYSGGSDWGLDHVAHSECGYPSERCYLTTHSNYSNEVLVGAAQTVVSAGLDEVGAWSVRSPGGAYLLAADQVVTSIADYSFKPSGLWSLASLIAGFVGDINPIHINCSTPAGGTTGTPYLYRTDITGGSGPYAVSLYSGSLPPGLNVTLTGDINSPELIVSGTPLKPGVFVGTVRVTDNVGYHRDCTLTFTLDGLDLDCPCGPVRQITLTSITDRVYTVASNMTPGFIDFGFPVRCCVPEGCLFTFCAGYGLGRGSNATMWDGTASWTGQDHTVDITPVLAQFDNDLAAMLGSLSAFAAGAGYSGLFLSATPANKLTVLDFYVTLYFTHGATVLRPQESHGIDPSNGRGSIQGGGLGVILSQWSMSPLTTFPYMEKFSAFPAELAPPCPRICDTPPCFWLDLWVWRQLRKFVGLDDDVEFPQGYDKALTFSLAEELASEFKLPPNPDVVANAALARKHIADLNASNDAATQDPPVN